MSIELQTEKLIALVRQWNEHDEVPQAQQDECRAIGIELDRLGGLKAMQDAYYAAYRVNRCAMVVQAYWDNIGIWRW